MLFKAAVIVEVRDQQQFDDTGQGWPLAEDHFLPYRGTKAEAVVCKPMVGRWDSASSFKRSWENPGESRVDFTFYGIRVLQNAVADLVGSKGQITLKAKAAVWEVIK